MFRRYEFHSNLSQEEIYRRLALHCKPAKWDSIDSRTFYYKRHKRGFSLTYTGEWYVRGALPFWAEVTAEQSGSLISGSRPVWCRAWQTVALFFGFTILVTPVFRIPLSMYPEIVLLLLSAVPIYAGFGGLANAIFCRKQQKAVLEFIQQHLLE